METINASFSETSDYQQVVLAAKSYKPWEAFKLLEQLGGIKEVSPRGIVTAITQEYIERIKQNQSCIVLTSREALPELDTAIREALKVEESGYAVSYHTAFEGKSLDCVLMYEHEACFSTSPHYWYEALATANQTAIAYTTDKAVFEEALGITEMLEQSYLDQQAAFEAYLQDMEDRGRDLQEVFER